MDSPNHEKNRRILIIDDTETIHKDFRLVLQGDDNPTDTRIFDQAEAAILGTESREKQEQFELDSAYQGQEGLEKVRQSLQNGKPYAMAFVDVRMPPGWDGIETIRRIWQVDPDLQVVICTAYSDYSLKEIIKELGVTEKLLILKKPFDAIEVYQLAISITEKWFLSQRARMKNEELESLVQQQTQQISLALEDVNKAYEAKSNFLANVSHEIRTPMNAIVGFGELLALEVHFTPKQKEYMDTICESCRNLLTVIDDILDFSRIEAGKLTLDIVDCALPEMIEQLGALLQPSARNKGLAFEILSDSQLPAVIRTDPLRVRQCLVHLVNNAIKFTEKGGITVRVSPVTVEGPNPSRICFEVEDTGIGIDRGNFDLIFQAFTQADSGTSRKYAGNGLGLAITQQLAELLGGTITVSSQPGKGSIFRLTIPTTNDGYESTSQNSRHIAEPVGEK
ncbi:MAG: response regulator [Phycisphaerae bacterium]|nr:response regulator [Phycisphaerae bacterium]